MAVQKKMANNIFIYGLVVFVVSSTCYILPEKENGFLFEGDMILSKDEIKNAVTNGRMRSAPNIHSLMIFGKDGPKAAASTAKRYYKWTDGIIPYVINSKLKCVGESLFKKAFCFLGGATDSIEKAISEYEKHTCIRFKPRTNERDYVEFIDNGFGKCYSHVGRIGGRQVIALGRLCRKKGTVIHEMMHAIGFFHEQSRPDRDDYVTILWDNIKKGAKVNFKKYNYDELDDQGMKYDLSSIMHYDNNAFAKWPWLKTIVPKRKRGFKIGQRDIFSIADVKEINKYYGCLKYL